MILGLDPGADFMNQSGLYFKAYLHRQWFSVSDVTAASKDRNNPIFCAVSDAVVASNTENHGLCKQTIKY
jgi:hypothetical protein